MTATTEAAIPTIKSSAKGLKKGAIWTRHSKGTVQNVVGPRIELRNSQGEEWSIDRSIFEKEFTVADCSFSQQIVSRTTLIDIITNAAQTAMTVRFRKKLDEKSYSEKVLEYALQVAGDDMTQAAFKKAVRQELQGEERTMLGYHERSFDEHGRLRFIDMEPGGGLRLIDLRTVEYAIVNGVEYTVS